MTTPGVKVESLPLANARAEKMLFDKTREEHELQLSMENISELKNESERFVSEEEALTQRIMKWQKDVLMEQEHTVKREPESVEVYSQILPERTTKFLETSGSIPQSEVVHRRKPVLGSTATDKLLLGKLIPTGLQMEQGDGLKKPPADELLTDGSETKLPRDSEYFLSEEEALAHRILKCSVKDGRGHEASPDQGLSAMKTIGVPLEGHEITSAKVEMPHRCSRESSLVTRSFPCHSLHDVLLGEARSMDSVDEYAIIDDKTQSESFHWDARDEREIEEEAGTTRENIGESSKQKDDEGLRREERSRDLIKSKQLDEISPERLALRAIKQQRRVQEDSDVNDGVHQSQTSNTGKKGGVSAEGSHPVFLKEMSSVKVKVGEMSEFTCQFHGDPTPTVIWLKDGHPLAHDPDYNIINKCNESQLIIFYPTIEHEGTYDCVIANKHGKSICSGTLESSHKSGGTEDMGDADELEKHEQNLEDLKQEEMKNYMDSGKATLQVPQVVTHRRLYLDESLSSSPVQIRITAPTPTPGIMEERRDDKPETLTEKTSEDEETARPAKRKRIFSFDVVAEAPRVVSELEDISCSEGSVAVLKCVVTGEPSPEVTWYYNDICLHMTVGKHSVEADDKVHRLHINDFTFTDAGVYRCVARSKLGEVTSVSDVSLRVAEPVQFSDCGGAAGKRGFTPSVRQPPVSLTRDAKHVEDRSQKKREPSVLAVKARPESFTASGCGLAASAAVIKVSDIKQAFESDSLVVLRTFHSQEQAKERLLLEEFIPTAASVEPVTRCVEGGAIPPPAVRGNPGSPKAAHIQAETDSSQTMPFSGESVYDQTLVAQQEVSSQSTSSLKEDVSVVSGDVRQGAVLAESHDPMNQSLGKAPKSPLIRPQPGNHEQVEAGEKTAKDETFEKSISCFAFQSQKVPSAKCSVGTLALVEETVEPKITFESLDPGNQEEVASSFTMPSNIKIISMGVLGAAEEVVIAEELTEDGKGLTDGQYGKTSFPESGIDSGVFFSMPAARTTTAGDVVRLHTQTRGDEVEVEPKKLILIPKVDDKVKELLPEDATSEETQVAPEEECNIFDMTSSDAGAAAFGFLEEEEVTFGTVYDYYNPPTDWGRPLSPESEMSIEVGSPVSEEVADVAERFYTPGSSTEASQPVAELFHTPKSASCDTPSGFITPPEYPLPTVEHTRPLTADSDEQFFSPVQFLTSPGDKGIAILLPEINVDDNQVKRNGSRSLVTLQEKVQGIPPAFLKPLIKKRLFENDSLAFHAEVFGVPSPEVKWFHNKTQLVADNRVQMERDGDSILLTIHNVTKTDQGEYICEAVNYVGEARSVAFVVVVSQEMRFMPAPPAVTHQHVMEFDVEEDSSRSPSPQEILLEVELDENEVKQFEKKVTIVTIPEYTADNKSMVISLDVLPSIYEEGAVDFVTQERDDLKIAFEVTEMPPRFINPICDVEAPEGSTVVFECSLMGIPSPVMSWFKCDKKIPHNNKTFLQSSDGDNHFLKICKVTLQDSGVYTCRAINIVGETLCRASLMVLNSKQFTGKARGKELTAVSLGSAKVHPQKFDLVVGHASPGGEQVSEIELEFEFEQEEDESQRAVRLVANTDSETSEQGQKYLSINFDLFAEPSKDDRIEFKGKSSDACSFQFQVTDTPPKCVVPLTNITAAVGTPVVLQCLFSGKPTPTAQWYKDGARVTDGRCIIQEKSQGHFNLLVTNVTQSDAGEYKCVIRNPSGCVETEALLKVF
ncbi:muscle M-line assembly protein unc-89-like [Brachionichthys hirsutus]|uniref:muscle M-line assembly protein unc-89-like n=1 Tax=Brachionichthys hirsutus TaxID=412623 RepID=UPI003604F50C